MEQDRPGMLKPALISGAALGFLSGVPGFDVLNCCTCCSLGIGAGFLASYLYSRELRRRGFPFEAGTGAAVGAITGVVWGMASALVSTVAHVAFGNVAMEWVMPFLENNPSIPPEALDQIRQALEESVTPVSLVVGIMFDLALGAVFATVGGLIGGAVFKIAPSAPPAPSAE